MEAEVYLDGMEFYAYHGVYEQEQKIGNRFLVDVKITFQYDSSKQEDLSKTVNYEKVYAIVKDRMQVKARLLETLASVIIDNLFTLLPLAETVEVKVSKYNPPVGGHCQRARVALKKKRGE
ncbi:MAG: dihydroneopterin aldolase [Cytophagaceae bacterium]|jgi:dihydroneopterin aldolase|nr:dihydroneopterin aldolase [Cytophagaceae bacterium]